MISVPFSASWHLWDAFDLDGILQVGPAALAIEYEGEWTKYGDDGKPAGTTQWGATRLEIPFTEIVSIRLRRLWLAQPRVLLQVRSVRVFDGFPLAKGVQGLIPIPRGHRRDAELLVAEVENAIADAELLRLGHGIESITDGRQ